MELNTRGISNNKYPIRNKEQGITNALNILHFLIPYSGESRVKNLHLKECFWIFKSESAC
jgi:hypothetical protein